MKNPYKIYLDNFFETINDLKHTTNRINKVLLKDVERYTKKEANFLSGTALIIGDWTGPTDNGWKKTFHTGIRKTTFKKNYASEIEKILSREFGLAFSQCYEALETLLKDFVYQKIQTDKYFKEKLNKEYSRESLKGGEDIFKMIKKASGKRFLKYSNDNNSNFKFSELFRIFSEVRHSITHSKGQLNSSKIFKNKYYKDLFEYLFPLNKLENDFIQLKFDYKSLNNLLNYLAEFGYQIFKILSEEDNYEWKI
ncbi:MULTISPECIES: hypothetical protein [Mesonia]|uniref:Uncharacterized protein n=1 Tax=Mesonia oceanica TaxID=2687242 RepID=A0AC61YAA6_9FLAO|nr:MULTISPECIES: hypothetical protein [Mesonia]MAN28389.1 hypothetical protein [Mesonia sp.]MAQ40555.1 hypothetical protein [Mesonia sp.]VVV01063.1 hypothetical protein FVB9532_02341 [Mesonia oceanica]|tara:strand:- start:1066 stop:1824 length:759 start_codon:yes stop_codon:yes gene_type:complete